VCLVTAKFPEGKEERVAEPYISFVIVFRGGQSYNSKDRSDGKFKS